jgi:cellulose synthase/poly-beta-1,6-N-acetylglucosamine synthase-like glycosyltransferase
VADELANAPVQDANKLTMSTNLQRHVFVSYVREDAAVVDRLCQELKAHGVSVWLDKEQIAPGRRWQQAIRAAIQAGSYFIACFSEDYQRRSRSYLNEELTEAIEILRQVHPERVWLIPVRLTDCDIPDRSIGGGETLRDLQRVDLFRNWQQGVDQILSVVSPPKKKLSNDLAFVIPMFNEEGVIGPTLSGLISRRYHQRYNVIVCDDASDDGSLEEARANAEPHDGISVIEHRPNGRKVGAIRYALQHVQTPFVLLMDADSMIHEVTPGALDSLIIEMKAKGLMALAFKIRPRARRFVERLQRLEYLLFTDSIRRLLGVVVCLVGQGVLWETETLKRVLARHTGIFEGDDLEATMLVSLVETSGRQIGYESKRVIVTTTLKDSWAALLRQRVQIWDVGLLHSFVDTPEVFWRRGRNVTFLRTVFFTEILAHVFKVLSLPTLCILALYASVRLVGDGSWMWSATGLVSQLSIVGLKTLVWIGRGYTALWLLTVMSIWFGEMPAVRRALGLSLFFTLYLGTPWFVFWAPSVGGVFVNTSQALGQVYFWLGPVLFLTYAWWYVITVLLVLAGSEEGRDKARMSLLAFAMPLYYVIVFVAARTVGFSWYLVGRMRGSFKPIRNA